MQAKTIVEISDTYACAYMNSRKRIKCEVLLSKADFNDSRLKQAFRATNEFLSEECGAIWIATRQEGDFHVVEIVEREKTEVA